MPQSPGGRSGTRSRFGGNVQGQSLTQTAAPGPLSPAADITRIAPQMENSVVTPPPDAEHLTRQRNSLTLQSSVVAPPPVVDGSNAASFQALQPAVVAPPPRVEVASTRPSGDLNIGPSAVMAPAPQLFVAEFALGRLLLDKGEAAEAVKCLQRATELDPEKAQAHFGWLAMFAGFDMPASSAQTRKHLGWNPTGPGLIADLENMQYIQA